MADSGRSAPMTCRAALDAATQRLAAAGVPDARRDAQVLLCAALNVDTGVLMTDPDRLLPDAAAEWFAGMISDRAARKPVARILGRRDFWSLTLAVNPATLDPRPDSETLIESVLARVKDHSAPLRLLDLGTGTGCLLLALLKELPTAYGIGLDRDPAAVAAARQNADRAGLGERAAFVAGDWTAPVSGFFDVVVSNPPYLRVDELDSVAPEVARYDPRAALDGGPDGLAAYRRLVPQLYARVAPEGLVVLEVGYGQDRAVRALLDTHGLQVLGYGTDLGGVQRCVIATVSRFLGNGAQNDVGTRAEPN